MKTNIRRDMSFYFEDHMIATGNIVSVCTGLCLMLFRNTNVKLWVFGTAVLVLLFIIWFMNIRIARLKRDIVENATIISGINQFRRLENKDLIILNKNNILTLGAIINMYYIHNEFEEHIATGYVENIQVNEVQLIRITAWHTDEKTQQECLHNNFKYVNNVIIKPILKTYGGHDNE